MTDNKPYSALAALAHAPTPASNYDIASVLDSVAKNPRDRFYKNQDIYLDGYTFTNCCFANCRFYTETGIFALKSCMVMRDCQFFYGQSALRVIKLFNLQFPNMTALHPNYNVVNEQHGTITLE